MCAHPLHILALHSPAPPRPPLPLLHSSPPQEIDALFKGQKQNCVVYFLDETFEELQYDASTTVMEAVEHLAGQIKLENYQTFSLFAVSKVRLLRGGHWLVGGWEDVAAGGCLRWWCS